MQYLLMNKDIVLATLEVTNTVAHIVEIHNNIPGYLGNIQSWLDGRTSPIGRQNIDTLLKLAGIRNKQEYLSVTHGISLTDTFWVKEINSNTSWNKINPYKNKFSRIISEVAINGQYYGGDLRSPSPEYSLDGSADKCWKRVNKSIYLYKTSGEKWSGITGNRPYCEYYANQVANKLIHNKRHFVPYRIKVSKTKEGYRKAYVYCPIFTNEQYGYLPLSDSIYKYSTIEELYTLVDVDSKLKLREMMLLDSIIMNYDRHKGNYGFYVDNDAFEIKRVAPIFDQDCSLGGFVSLQSVDTLQEAYRLAHIKAPRTEMGSYIEQGRWALTSELVSNMKNMYPFHFERLPKDIDLEDERIEFMEYIVNSQIKAILGI